MGDFPWISQVKSLSNASVELREKVHQTTGGAWIFFFRRFWDDGELRKYEFYMGTTCDNDGIEWDNHGIMIVLNYQRVTKHNLG